MLIMELINHRIMPGCQKDLHMLSITHEAGNMLVVYEVWVCACVCVSEREMGVDRECTTH